MDSNITLLAHANIKFLSCKFLFGGVTRNIFEAVLNFCSAANSHSSKITWPHLQKFSVVVGRILNTVRLVESSTATKYSQLDHKMASTYCTWLLKLRRQQAAIYKNILLTITTNIFTFDVSVSIRDLHQKKYDQFFFRFLPQ